MFFRDDKLGLDEADRRVILCEVLRQEQEQSRRRKQTNKQNTTHRTTAGDELRKLERECGLF